MSAIHTIRAELRYLVRELGLLDKNCFQSGLSLTQAHLLTYLSHNGLTPFAELCLQLNMDKASLSRTLNALIEKNYVEILLAPKDKRHKSFQLTCAGRQKLRVADNAADHEFSFINAEMAQDDVEAIIEGLRSLRVGVFRRNVIRAHERIQVEPLRENYRTAAENLVFSTFSTEQKIPDELISVPDQYESQWWVARSGEYVLGTVACWRENNRWHWGRFAVDPKYRRLGIGKRLAVASLSEILLKSDEILLEARDTTVNIILRLGGEVTGPTYDFYGMPITPMRLIRQDFEGRCEAAAAMN